jgi:DNA replication protein DnaC
MSAAQLKRLQEQMQRLRLFKGRERLEALLQDATTKEASYADFLDTRRQSSGMRFWRRTGGRGAPCSNAKTADTSTSFACHSDLEFGTSCLETMERLSVLSVEAEKIENTRHWMAK